MAQDNMLDAIVRFHDLQRLPELERCMFSLVGQSYRPLHIILVVQRFSEGDVRVMRDALAPLLKIENAPDMSILNWEEPQPIDARSVLLNLGLSRARGRYVAFLDYDDVLYPEAYQILIERLQESGAAIAFAAVRAMSLQPYDQFFHSLRELVPNYAGSNLADLFRNNFCPIYSYIIDRSQISGDIFYFEPDLVFEEDYDLLLRICAQFRSDFTLVNTKIGEYFFKTDRSNTSAGGLTGSQLLHYNQVVIPAIEKRRQSTEVSAAVRESLRIPNEKDHMTIRDVLRYFGHTA